MSAHPTAAPDLVQIASIEETIRRRINEERTRLEKEAGEKGDAQQAPDCAG